MFYLILGSVIGKKKGAKRTFKKMKMKKKNKKKLSPERSETILVSITELPHHILGDIISRLPFKTILRCKYVCKGWLNLITHDFDFASTHSSRSYADLVIRPRSPNYLQEALYFVDLEGDTNKGFGVSVPLNPKFHFPLSDYTLVNDCRGLLCLRKAFLFSDPSIVYNPVTSEYIAIPESNEYAPIKNIVASGFGFSPRTKEYKVLRICWTVVEVYVLGSDSWRSAGNYPYSPVGLLTCPTYLNGAIHWLFENPDLLKSLVSFNFDEEAFVEIPFPSHFGDDQLKGEDTINIGFLGEYLFVCDLFPFGYFEIWIMKEYGVQQSWSKYFVVDTMATHVLHNKSFKPLKCLSNGEILMAYTEDTLVCYNPQSKGLRYLGFYGNLSKFETLLSPSFVSLKDVLRNDNVEVLNITSRCDHGPLEEYEALYMKEYISRSVGSEPRMTY